MYRSLIFLCFLIIGCSGDEEMPIQQPPELHFEFASDVQGWEGGFADYPEGGEVLYELEFGHSMLPPPLDETQNSLKQSGNNHSDDLFHVHKKKDHRINAKPNV